MSLIKIPYDVNILFGFGLFQLLSFSISIFFSAFSAANMTCVVNKSKGVVKNPAVAPVYK